MYVKNFNPQYNYNMDIRAFNQLEDLPDELYHLDILDGSPTCTTFSSAGAAQGFLRGSESGVSASFSEFSV
jgi:site-specific DNA-cytosine methylase